MTSPSPLASLSESKLQAFLETILLVAYADGEFAESEKDRLVSRVHELSGETLDKSALEEKVLALQPPSYRSGEDRGERVKRLRDVLDSEELCRIAFTIAVEVAHVDGGIGVREGSTLAATAREFGLSSTEALDLLRTAQLD
mgnify:FL=1